MPKLYNNVVRSIDILVPLTMLSKEIVFCIMDRHDISVVFLFTTVHGTPTHYKEHI